MFSYLRPHHKRHPSNPTSPADQSHSFEPPLHANSPLDNAHPHRFQDAEPKPSSSSHAQITRVSSADSTIDDWRKTGHENEQRQQHWDALRSNSRQGEINTQSNHQRISSIVVAQRPESAGSMCSSSFKSPQHTRTQAAAPSKESSKAPGQQFVTAADFQNKTMQKGRRPAGVRLPTPPPLASTQVSTFDPVQPKSGKARLNLLNPMSLLARRRTSQAVPQLLSESLVSKRGADTYDFQIKGNFVHDFSAPRTRRNVSYDSRIQDAGNQQQYQKSPNLQVTELKAPSETPVSPWNGGNYTPIFTENFDEEQYPAAGFHVRKANDISDLPLPKPPYAKGSRKQSDLDSIQSSNLNIAPAKPGHETDFSDRKSTTGIGPEVPSEEKSELLVEPRRVSIDPGANRAKSTASSIKGQPRKVSEVSNTDGIPRHMKSTSSRFSFDMIGAAEQERLLEERHRQRALERKNEQPADDTLDDDFDNYDYDDDLEEKIPGVNADLEEDHYDGIYEEEILGINADLEDDFDETMPNNGELCGFTFQHVLASPISTHSPGMASTPRDANGEVIGFAMTKGSPYVPAPRAVSSPLTSNPNDNVTVGIAQKLQGLGLQGIDMVQATALRAASALQDEGSFPKPDILDVDDLYYDDGIIGDQDIEELAEFDESVFDNVDTDQYGRPIRSLSSLPTLYSPPSLIEDPSPSFNKIVETKTDVHDNLVSPKTEQPANLAPRPSVAMNNNPVQTSQSLTQDSLAAYQSALAEAANRAAAEGKFRRASTSTFQNSTEKELDETQTSLMPQSSGALYQEPFASSYDLEDDFDYDDLMEDDAIIAAANAEALANDSDGFYGQEFNFYSAPGGGNTEYVNGGYFGPRGVEGINRSTSGRVASREPNLTPITERSEYSNRNSVMGFSVNKGDIVSPGLSQLAGMLREEGDGDLSLDALMKLRRGAWGGSQASLHSSNGGTPRSAGFDDGSPLGGQPPWHTGNQNKQPLHMRRNSGFSGASIISDNSPQSGNVAGLRNSNGKGMEIGPPLSEPSSLPPSPTLVRSSSVLGMEYAPMSPRSPNGIPSPTSIGSPMSRGGSNEGQFRGRDDNRNSFRKHRYTGSADSISYLKEEDPINGERWILERRRTADSGEVEVGREVVSGGRI